MATSLERSLPVLPRVVLAVLLTSVACSRPEAPPGELTADHVAEALGGVPHGGKQAGPSLIVPDEFADVWQTWTGDLDGIVRRRVLRVLVTHSSTHYYVDRGRQGGIAYEMFRLLEKDLNRRFQTGALSIDVLFIPVERDRLIPALLEGHGDIAAAALTVTEARLKLVDFSLPIARGVEEVVVSGPGVNALNQVEDLSGRKVHVRPSSSYAESLEALNATLRDRGLDPVEIVPVDERLETEDVLEMVNAGVFSITVVDDYLASLWSQVLDEIEVHRDVAVGSGRSIAWALRRDCPKLKAVVDEFLRGHRAGTLTGNVILNRYLRRADRITNPGDEEDFERFRSMVGLFERYGEQYHLEWLFLVAQAYQESGLDNSKRSPRGAVGVMQLLPSTAGDPNVNIPDVHLLERNIEAGAKYLRFILDRYFPSAEMDNFNRHLFALAAYNAGPARVRALRREAAQVGLDPNRWLDNVEVVAARRVGREPVQYVSNILKYYFAYRLLAERSLGRSAARKKVEG
jgi:membrane-bound lytic murein transglycosylase MltF